MERGSATTQLEQSHCISLCWDEGLAAMARRYPGMTQDLRPYEVNSLEMSFLGSSALAACVRRSMFKSAEALWDGATGPQRAAAAEAASGLAGYRLLWSRGYSKSFPKDRLGGFKGAAYEALDLLVQGGSGACEIDCLREGLACQRGAEALYSRALSKLPPAVCGELGAAGALPGSWTGRPMDLFSGAGVDGIWSPAAKAFCLSGERLGSWTSWAGMVQEIGWPALACAQEPSGHKPSLLDCAAESADAVEQIRASALARHCLARRAFDDLGAHELGRLRAAGLDPMELRDCEGRNPLALLLAAGKGKTALLAAMKFNPGWLGQADFAGKLPIESAEASKREPLLALLEAFELERSQPKPKRGAKAQGQERAPASRRRSL